MSIRILFVEDDERICNTVKAFLSEARYKVDACLGGDEAHTKFYDNTYQLVIKNKIYFNRNIPVWYSLSILNLRLSATKISGI